MQRAVVVLVLTLVALLATATTLLRSFGKWTFVTHGRGALRHEEREFRTGPMDDSANATRWPASAVSPASPVSLSPSAPVLASGYLFNPNDLHSCGANDFDSRPPELLCRAPRQLTQEAEQYVATLAITDKDFFDVFEESEIFKLFKPRPWYKDPTLKFATHDNHTGLLSQYTGIANAINVQRNQYYDAEYSFFFAMANSRGLVASESRLQHLNYLPLAISRLSEVNAQFFKDHESSEWTLKYLESLVTSKEFSDSSAVDFFSVVGGPIGLDYLREKSEKQWAGSSPAQAEAEVTDLALRPALLAYSSVPLTAACQVIMGGSPIARMRLNRAFPRGSLPSYQYALGALANLLETREFNFWSVAQWNDSLKHQTLSVKSLSNKFSPSAFTGSTIDEDLPPCERGQLEGCRVEYDQFHLDRYPYTLLRSRFALVLPQTEYLTSPRLMDVIAAGAIPVIVFREILSFGLPGQCHVPWRELAIFIDEQEFEQDPAKALETHVLGKTQRDVERMLRLLEYYRPDILFTMEHTRVPQGRLRELALRCVPEAFLSKQRGQSKSALSCDFEDFSSTPAFLPLADEDDDPAWRAQWFPQISKLLPPRS